MNIRVRLIDEWDDEFYRRFPLLFADVQDQSHPDCWSVCGQDEVMSMVRELQAHRAARRRIDSALSRLGASAYVPVMHEDGGYRAHHDVVKVVRAAIADDAEFESYWRA